MQVQVTNDSSPIRLMISPLAEVSCRYSSDRKVRSNGTVAPVVQVRPSYEILITHISRKN